MNSKFKKDIELLVRQKKEEKKNKDVQKVIDAFNEVLKKGLPLKEDITVYNFSELIKYLSINFPDTFKIENPEDIAKHIKIPPQTELPKSFAISNAHDIAKYIRFPKGLSIDNLSELKPQKVDFPENLKKLSFQGVEVKLQNIYEKLLLFAQNFPKSLFISNKTPKDAIPVVLVDSDLKRFYEARSGGGGIGLNILQETYLKVIYDNVDKFAKYKPQDLDDDEETTGVNYYGYADVGGDYYILEEDLDNKTYRYYAGKGNYVAKWSNRASLEYDYLFNVTIN